MSLTLLALLCLAAEVVRGAEVADQVRPEAGRMYVEEGEYV